MKKIEIGLLILISVVIGVSKVEADEIKTPTFTSVEQVTNTEVKLNFKTNSTCSVCGIEIKNETTGQFYRVANTATSYNIKGLTTGKTYKFTIGQYYITSGIYYNSAWTAMKSITLENKTIDDTSVVTPYFAEIHRGDYNKLILNYAIKGTISGVQIYNVTTGKYINTTNKRYYTLSGLTYNKTYKIKIRSYLTKNGKTYYSSWTPYKTRTVKLPTPECLKICDSTRGILINYDTSRGTVSAVQVYNPTKGYKMVPYKSNFHWSGFTAGKTYKIKVRSYLSKNGKKYYSDWTAYDSTKYNGKIKRTYNSCSGVCIKTNPYATIVFPKDW